MTLYDTFYAKRYLMFATSDSQLEVHYLLDELFHPN